MFDISIDEIRHLLVSKQKDKLPNTKGYLYKQSAFKRPAAVLMPLFFDSGEWHLLFTRRSDRLNDHKGQVSFPGGAWEVGDNDLTSTALRETWEEIGIEPKVVTILGKLEPRELITGFEVTPVVGKILWPYSLKILEDEVAKVFSIPLNWLADEENWILKDHYYQGQIYKVIYYLPYDGEVLWGASASMTLELIDLLKLKYRSH